MPTARDDTTLHGERVAYRVKSSDEAGEVRLEVDLDGVTVIVPEADDVDAEALLQDHADWVLEQRDRYARYRDQMPDRSFEEGETFLWLGDERPIRLESVDDSQVTDEAFVLAEAAVEAESIRTVLEALYRREARAYFRHRADEVADALGVDYDQLQIRNQKTRWGSYSPQTGTLSLNWRLIMAPPRIVDYMLVHELAHAQYPNHGARFWRLVREHVPDYEAREAWLERNSARLVFEREGE